MRRQRALRSDRRRHPVRNILILVLILIVAVLLIGYKIGFLRITITGVDNRDDKESVAIETIEMWVVDQGGNHETYTAAFDEDGNTSIRLPAGTYQFWYNYDGFLATDGFTTEVSLSGLSGVQLVGTSVPGRYLLIEFVDEEETTFQPETLVLTDENGSAYEYITLTNGMLMLEFDNDTQEVSVVIEADDYEPVTAVVDLTESRSIKLIVMFQE